MRIALQWALLLALAAALVACPKDEGAANGTLTESTANTIDTATLEDLYNKNCSICHGKSLEGRPGMAPALSGLKANWKSADELTKYLVDPQGYADKDERLGAERGKYSMRMPAIPTITDEDRKALAVWLLEQ